jgi:hypothetical protein
MSPRGLKPAALAAACALGLAAPSHSAPPRPWAPSHAPRALSAPAESAAAAKPPASWVNDEPDTGQFLPDTTLLARVGDREIRVGDYVDAYFRSYAEYRPRPDSAGRLEFLNSMINKEVLGLTALEINRPLGFEDRATLREHRQRVLSNLLFQRAVLDSATVSDAEMRQLYEQYRHVLHLRHIQFADPAAAERARRDLVSGRIKWKAAVRTYSVAPDSDRARDGDLGWHSRLGFDPGLASTIFGLEPGEISSVLMDAQGHQLVQVLEMKPDHPPHFEDVRSTLRSEIRDLKIGRRAEAIQALLRVEIGMTYDTSSIAWASSRFSPARSTSREGNTTSLDFDAGLPDFTPADTSRVLARSRYGQLTLGGLLEEYGAIQPMLRPNVNDYESMRSFLDGIVLEPHMADLATRRGLERDPVAIRQLEERREQILVEHMYADSITSKVWIRPQERSKYYQDHLAGFVTYPKVRFSAFVRTSRAAADSLAARLRAGEKAEDLLRADSLLGRVTGSIQERSQNEHGTPYYKLLFEELRPGQVATDGPDRAGEYGVIQLLSFDPGHQLRYEEVESIIDESLQNIRAEERLKEFLSRQRKRYRIEAHTELLGRIRMVDPTLAD